ncbi:LuxR C-terminal-related transcriptional regulator [Dactylosporangium sp. NPDC006015]|uniref:LuxR C-terminal-related transcriptional regulator n=1 Tax=Dactylosporangium sp. NPDC006015 TaxID=3154576 RepID=UPI00339DB532
MPDLPPGYVLRDRVVAQLDAAVRAPLTLVTAPAGWGKTAALVAWARTVRIGDEVPVVSWVTAHSPDGADVPGRLRGALSAGDHAAPAGDLKPDLYAEDLPRAVDALDRPHVVVVDDVREISDQAALAELESLVRHGMGRLHLVLSCRRDPALPLYRWRVNGSLTEVRTTDLSLTIAETAQLLAAHDVVLPGSTLYALHSMTEGWPAGVRLAAMAMRGHPEPERVLDDGGAYSTAVGDFLTGEVIETLPADTRRLLLDTAVATRLNAGLVEAITGRDDGARVLAELKGSNAFLTRNAGPGGWYRFHPLFARTLHSELQRRNPERVAELHRRAAAWHSTYGIPAEAMRHALLAEDWTGAVETLDRHWPDIVGGVRYDRPHEAAPHPPAGDEHADPRLALAFAAERLRVGDLEGTRDYLRRSNRAADTPPTSSTGPTNPTAPTATGPTATGPTASSPTASSPTTTGPAANGTTTTATNPTGPTATGTSATGTNGPTTSTPASTTGTTSTGPAATATSGGGAGTTDAPGRDGGNSPAGGAGATSTNGTNGGNGNGETAPASATTTNTGTAFVTNTNGTNGIVTNASGGDGGKSTGTGPANVAATGGSAGGTSASGPAGMNRAAYGMGANGPTGNVGATVGRSGPAGSGVPAALHVPAANGGGATAVMTAPAPSGTSAGTPAAGPVAAAGGTSKEPAAAKAPARVSARMMAGFMAAEAWLSGDPRRTLAALGELNRPEDQTDEVRALSMLDEGAARLRLGELAAAGSPLHGALVLAQRTGMAQTQVCAAAQLSVLEAARGRLRAAARLGRQALVTADRFGITDATDLGWVRMALASVYGEWDRIAEADRLLDEGLDLAAGDPDLLVAIATVRAKLRHGSGRLAAALEVLHTARRELGGAPLTPSVERALALTEAELRISGGDLGAARRLVATGGDPDVYPGWAACVDASAALVEGKAAAAASTAQQYATPSVDTALTWTVHAAILTSLAGRALGDRNRVLRGLEVALDIAEEESFRRPFLVGGHPVRDLLANFAPLLPVYHPLAAELAAGSSPLAGGGRGADGSLVEPLTERELTVLRYLQGTMSNLEIASTLYVSVNTVKTHVKNIYRKLHAGRRREAVERARELRLL